MKTEPNAVPPVVLHTRRYSLNVRKLLDKGIVVHCTGEYVTFEHANAVAFQCPPQLVPMLSDAYGISRIQAESLVEDMLCNAEAIQLAKILLNVSE